MWSSSSSSLSSMEGRCAKRKCSEASIPASFVFTTKYRVFGVSYLILFWVRMWRFALCHLHLTRANNMHNMLRHPCKPHTHIRHNNNHTTPLTLAPQAAATLLLPAEVDLLLLPTDPCKPHTHTHTHTHPQPNWPELLMALNLEAAATRLLPAEVDLLLLPTKLCQPHTHHTYTPYNHNPTDLSSSWGWV